MSSPALQPALLTSGRALRYYNLFRVASIAALLMMTQWAMPFLEGRNAWLSGWLGMYAGLAVFGLLLGRTRLPLSWSITLSLAGDIALLVLYMHEYGGVQSGFGMLLLPFLAVAGMLVPGRLALFHAAMATLAVFASVLADMLQRLGCQVDAVERPFQPEAGAYGGGHRHGHDDTFADDMALAQAVFQRHAPADECDPHAHLAALPFRHGRPT